MTMRRLLLVLVALLALMAGAITRSLFAQASPCYPALLVQTDSLRAETYRKSATGATLSPRAVVVRRLANRADSIAATGCVPAAPRPTLTLTISDSVLRSQPATPYMVFVTARSDSAGVFGDSAAFAVSDTTLARVAWLRGQRRLEITGAAKPGLLTITGRWGSASAVVMLRVHPDTGTSPDTTTPPGTPPPTGIRPPELPRAVPSYPRGLASLPCTSTVPPGSLPAALTAARGGAVLCLTGTHVGNFTVPARTDTGWVVIRSAGALAPGRMRPSQAGSLAKLESPNPTAALAFARRAVRTLVLGIEITATPTLAPGAGPVALVAVGTGAETSVADLPTDIAFERVYVHGTPTLHIRRAFMLNGAAQTVRDSWCDEIHAAGFDSQCTIAWNSPGPILIENNTLRAASENIMFGGADPNIPGVVASDVTVRRNHIEKPLSWRGGGWNVKNLIETKHSRRVLLEENVLDGSWTDGQVGYAMVLKSVSGGRCAWCVSADWTIRRNLIRNTAAAFSVAGRADQRGTTPTDTSNVRMAIIENWIEPLNVPPYTGDARPLIFVADNRDVTVSGNVWEGGAINAGVLFDLSGGKPPVTNLSMTRNVLPRGQYGLFASGTGEGAPSWAKGALGASTWAGNAMIGRTTATYPAGTTWHPDLASALASGAGVSRAVIDAGIAGVVQMP